MKSINKLKGLNEIYFDYKLKYISLGIVASTGLEVFGYNSSELIYIQESGEKIWSIPLLNICDIYCDQSIPYDGEKILTVVLTNGKKRYFKKSGDEVTPNKMNIVDPIYRQYAESEIDGAFFLKTFGKIPTKYFEYLDSGYYEVTLKIESVTVSDINIYDEYAKLKIRTNKNEFKYKIYMSEPGMHRICSYDRFDISYVSINKIEACQITYFIGDSTLANSTTPPRFGWAQLYFDTNISINYAECGRSLESFIFEGRLNYLLNHIKSGDRVIIGFGHNDEKNTFFGSNKEEYIKLLNYYIEQIESRNSSVIICTPIPRNEWVNGKIINTHSGYDNAINEMIKTNQIIDLSKYLTDHFSCIGEVETTKFYLHHPMLFLCDNTHLSLYGATFISSYIMKKVY